MAQPLVECVPNISEGRSRTAVDAVEASIRSVPGVGLLHRTSDRDHHRSVFTFAGRSEAVEEAAVRAAAAAMQVIDLRQHSGVHPRMGALDVLPFVPLNGMPMQECVVLAHRAGARIASELSIPVYFYGEAAKRPERARLEDVRRPRFEGLLAQPVLAGDLAPDAGPAHVHPTAGAVIVGARKVLIAFNINLQSSDLFLAKAIAKQIRERGGGLAGVKALGLPLESRGLVQVSTNITDHQRTPVHVVFQEVARLANAAGVAVQESELIGLMPRASLVLAGVQALQMANFQQGSVLEDLLEARLPPS